jgi:phosphoribosylglycinamide formyltransferase 1
MHRIAIFASGSGSNAEALVRHFADRPDVEITLLLTNNPHAGLLDRKLGIPTLLFDRPTFYGTDQVVTLLQQANVDVLVLAGFLWLIPPALLRAFPDRIVNIHPALLPKFGGKGMYGQHVHEAVVAAGETETGITIHLINERYDEGRTLFQVTCPVLPTDTSADVARHVLALEHRYFPVVVDSFLRALPTDNQ